MKSEKHLVIYSYFFREIKNRLLLLLITGISITSASYFYKEVLLFEICSNPAFSYIYTSVTEIFSIYIKLVSFVSNQIILGGVFFHVLNFLAPGLYDKEYYYIKIFFVINFYVIVFSIFFFNFIVFPLSCEFFLSFQNTVFKPLNFYFEAKIVDYLSFYVALYYICSFYFQFFIWLIFLFYTLDQKLKETKFFRKLFYFLFCMLSIFINSFFDLTGQILICTNFVLFFELMVFKVLVSKNLNKMHFLFKACSSIGRTCRS